MSMKIALIGAASAVSLTALGAWLWSSQGVTLWVVGAMAYCF